MSNFIIAPLLIFLFFGGWILVQYAARAVAKQHPELGPFREDGSCGGGCSHCSDKSSGCDTKVD